MSEHDRVQKLLDLIEAAKAQGKKFSVVKVPMGHHQMNESPEETLAVLKQFLT